MVPSRLSRELGRKIILASLSLLCGCSGGLRTSNHYYYYYSVPPAYHQLPSAKEIGQADPATAGVTAEAAAGEETIEAGEAGSGLFNLLFGSLFLGFATTPHYARVARTALFSDDQDSGPFGVFSYLIATQKDPQSPVGQRLHAAIDAYAREAPYCPNQHIDPSHVNLFVIPVTLIRPPDADHVLCRDNGVVSAMLMADYDTARASSMADKAGLEGQGPYLVASLKPLSMIDVKDQQSLLIWDVSAIEPQLLRLAVDEFVTSADRYAEWNKISLRKWAFELRNWIAISSQGWNISRAAASAAIKGPN